MDNLRDFFSVVALVVGAVLATILYVSGAAGIGFSLAADLFGRVVLAILIVGLGGGWLLRGRTLSDTLLALLPAIAGGLWVALWPLWDAWGQAVATVPSVLAYSGSVTNDADLPWYATGYGQWGGLVVSAVVSAVGWVLGRD